MQRSPQDIESLSRVWGTEKRWRKEKNGPAFQVHLILQNPIWSKPDHLSSLLQSPQHRMPAKSSLEPAFSGPGTPPIRSRPTNSHLEEAKILTPVISRLMAALWCFMAALFRSISWVFIAGIHNHTLGNFFQKQIKTHTGLGSPHVSHPPFDLGS